MPAPLMPDRLAGVYVLFSIHVPQKGYIGQSGDIAFRFTNEINQLRAGCHHNADVQAAYNAHPHGWGIIPLRLGLTDPTTRRAAEAEEIAKARARGKTLYNKLENDDGRDWN